MAFRRQRLLEEDVRFGAQAGSAASPEHEHADGLLAASIIEAGAHCLSKESYRIMSGVRVCADLPAVCHALPCSCGLHTPCRSPEQGASARLEGQNFQDLCNTVCLL